MIAADFHIALHFDSNCKGSIRKNKKAKSNIKLANLERTIKLLWQVTFLVNES